MSTRFDLEGPCDIAWCPGCGNHAILASLKAALEGLDLDPSQVVLVSGIGQAAKTPQYVRANYFNGLHGRALPVATAIKACNPELTVIVISGDGCIYGEGGNHFIHAMRRNPDITVIVHDNMVYGLTKGQASPMSRPGFRTPVQVQGVTQEPFNPVAVAVALKAPFVARSFSGDGQHVQQMLEGALTTKGLALVDIFQPCVSFNRLNTYQWFREHTVLLDAGHDPSDPQQALTEALASDPFPLGVISRGPARPAFEEQLDVHHKGFSPLYHHRFAADRLEGLLMEMR